MPTKPAKNICYAQSGGVTAVINATAAGVILAGRKNQQIDKIYAGENGILGILQEELIETWHDSDESIKQLLHTPGGAFGSCRIKLPNPQDNIKPYRRLYTVFNAYNIDCLLYNGGNDSADTSLKISAAMRTLGANTQCIGLPKTIDNDLPETDCCPGYGSVAKYIAVSVSETALDIQSMCRTSTKVFVMEVMGRHAGWIAAAAGLVTHNPGAIIILFPEVPFDEKLFLKAVKDRVKKYGYVVVVVSEGLKDQSGNIMTASSQKDQFSHQQLGGVALSITNIIKNNLALKCHWAICDYLQRSARHIASLCDLKQARAIGEAAVKIAIQNKNGVMPIIKRLSNKPYRWEIDEAPLNKIANFEKTLTADFLSKDKFFISKKAYNYLQPLIEGEAKVPYCNGLPVHASLKNKHAKKRLANYKHK